MFWRRSIESKRPKGLSKGLFLIFIPPEVFRGVPSDVPVFGVVVIVDITTRWNFVFVVRLVSYTTEEC